MPKELLPLVDRPVVRWVADELAACGIEDLAVVVAPGKEAVAEALGVGALLQPEPLGLGDAVLQAEAWAGDEPFAVALGDAVLGGHEPARVVERLAAALEERGAAAAVAVQRVPREKVSRYGIVAPAEGPTRAAFDVAALVEKPQLGETPSDFAIAARYVLAPAIFGALRRTAPGHGGEVQLTDAIALLLAEGARVVAVPLGPGERRWDVGDPESYAEAFVSLALEDPRFGARLRAGLDAQRDG